MPNITPTPYEVKETSKISTSLLILSSILLPKTNIIVAPLAGAPPIAPTVTSPVAAPPVAAATPVAPLPLTPTPVAATPVAAPATTTPLPVALAPQIIDSSKISTSLLILSSILLPKTNIIVAPLAGAPPIAPTVTPPVATPAAATLVAVAAATPAVAAVAVAAAAAAVAAVATTTPLPLALAPQIIDSSKISTSLLILSSILLPKTNIIVAPLAGAPPIAPTPVAATPVAAAVATTTPLPLALAAAITTPLPLALAPQIIDSSKISTSLLILSSILLQKTNKIVAPLPPLPPLVRPLQGYKKKYKYIINAHGGIRICNDYVTPATPVNISGQIITIEIPKNVELFTYAPLGEGLVSFETCYLIDYECDYYLKKHDSRGIEYVETPLKKYIYKEGTKNLFPDIAFQGEYTKENRFRFYSGIVHCIPDEYRTNDGSKKVKEIIHNIDADPALGFDCSCDLINPNFKKARPSKNLGALTSYSMSKKYICDGYSDHYVDQLKNGRRDPPLNTVELCGEIDLRNAIKIIQEDCKKRYGSQASSEGIIQIRIYSCLGHHNVHLYCGDLNKNDIKTIPFDKIGDFDTNLTNDVDILLDTETFRHYTFRFLGKNLILKTHKYKYIKYDTGNMYDEILIIKVYGKIIERVKALYLRDQKGRFGFYKNQFDLPQNSIIYIPEELSKKLFIDESGNDIKESAYKYSKNINPIARHIYEYIKNPHLQQPPAPTTTLALTTTSPTPAPISQIIDSSKILSSLLILSSILLPKTNKIVAQTTQPVTAQPVTAQPPAAAQPAQPPAAAQPAQPAQPLTSQPPVAAAQPAQPAQPVTTQPPAAAAAAASARAPPKELTPKELTTQELATIVSNFTKPNFSNIWQKVLNTPLITSLNKENLSKELNKELKKIDKELQKIDKVIDTQVDVNNIESLNSNLNKFNIIITDTQICFDIQKQGFVSQPVKSRPNFITMLNNFMKSDKSSKLDEKITKIYTIIDSNINNPAQLNKKLADFNISIIDNTQICIKI